ncbi:MAG: UvrD-helicase domain-containing protein, partial [Mycoplasmataceae bacterium]|nr:UvrD-helicase domain-containing protein [Mycoplasmataceae bacterium]
MEHSGTNEDILDGCSETQKEIIVANEKIILINACAGSGKTTTITKKIIYSLKNNQARPDEIIAITFTKKAAKELKTRIYELGQNFLGNIYGFDQMRIDTIHAFCLNLLKDFYHDLRKYK